MIYVFPRLWHGGSNNFIRRDSPLTVMRRFFPYDHQWRRVRRIAPGIWYAWQPWFLLDDDGFHRGRVR